MAFPPLYRDIGKNANDLTNKGFVSSDRYNWKIELDSTSENGVQLLPSITQTTSGGVDGELKSKFRANNASYTVSGNLKQEVSVEVAADKPLRGVLKPTVTLTTLPQNPLENTKVKVQTESRGPYGNLTSSVEGPVARFLRDVDQKRVAAPKGTVSAVVGLKEYGVSLGGELEIGIETGNINASNLVAAYSQGNLEVTAFRKKRNETQTIGANFYLRVPHASLADAAVGSELTHDFSDKPTTLTIAGTFKPDPSSTVKARINNKMVLGLAATQKLSGPFSASLLVDLDLSKPRDATALQWGVKLAVK